MHNNEFEKKLEHKLEELKFTPSEAVWQKVEMQIREQKRRRRFLYWLLPAAVLCIGIAGRFIYTSEENAEINKTIVDENKKTDPTSAKNNSTKEYAPLIEKKAEVTEKESQPINQTKKQEFHNRYTTNKLKSGLPVNSVVLIKKTNQHLIFKKPKKTKNVKTENAVTDKPAVEKIEPLVVNEPIVDDKQGNASINIKQEKQKEINESVFTDSAASVKDEMPLHIKDSPSVKKKKTEIAFVLKTGNTSISHFSAGRNSVERANNSTGSSTGGFPVRADSSTTGSGFGFSAGIQFKKPVTKRSAFSVGLVYTYYSSSNKTGNTVYSAAQFSNNVTTTSVNSYTRDGNSTTHQNNYHFIEVPVLYHLQLNKIEKRPISFNTGVAYAYLIKSNAQYYYRSTGAYYYDQKLFNNSHLQLQTGISIGLGKKLNYPLLIAVHYQYHLSGLWKQKLDLNQHLSFTGIQFTWRMKNK
jgi:Outer membrane protein beta-barrel domain